MTSEENINVERQQEIIESMFVKDLFREPDRGYAKATALYVESFLKNRSSADVQSILKNRPAITIREHSFVLPTEPITKDQEEQALNIGFLRRET